MSQSLIDQMAAEITKKMTLFDYQTDVQTPTLHGVNTPIPQEVKQSKVKLTVYLTEAHWKMFNELCLKEMQIHGKPEKSQIMCDAIEMLYHHRK